MQRGRIFADDDQGVPGLGVQRDRADRALRGEGRVRDYDRF
jgi:hypothetical protein